MRIKRLEYDLTVCKVADAREIDLGRDFYFIGRTEGEVSLVCRTEDAPEKALAREDGWKGFRVEGPLDFALVGILSQLAGALAARGISVFALSTYDTDYILVRRGDFARAAEALAAQGHTIV